MYQPDFEPNCSVFFFSTYISPELNVLFYMIELKNLMKSSYKRGTMLAYLTIWRQKLKVEF